MKAQKNRYELDCNRFNADRRERRAYRRRLRRQRQIIRMCLMTFMTLAIIIVCTVSYHAIQSSASAPDDIVMFKYYTKVTVGAGETLWDIADEYADSDYYKNKKSYIAEVININKLDADGTIKVGQHLIVPYYSSEFVK